MCDQYATDNDEINKEDSQGIRNNQNIIFCDLDVIDEDKETESVCIPTTTLTFLTICECPIIGRVVYK